MPRSREAAELRAGVNQAMAAWAVMADVVEPEAGLESFRALRRELDRPDAVAITVFDSPEVFVGVLYTDTGGYWGMGRLGSA